MRLSPWAPWPGASQPFSAVARPETQPFGAVATAACGLIGRRFTGRPVAERTAEATAAGAVTTGTADAGFAPKGATTSRSSTSLTMRMSGASRAVGSA